MKHILFGLLMGIIVKFSALAQDYQVCLENFEQLSEYELRFDIQIRNTRADASASGAWAYNSSQFQININPALINGGQLNGIYFTVDNQNSDLPANLQLTDNDFFFSAPHFSFATNSPSTSCGSPLLLLNHNEWRTIAGFRVRLRNATHDGFLNFGDVPAEFAFRIANTRVFGVDFYLDGEIARRGLQEDDPGSTTELLATGADLIVTPSTRQLSGFWFYGTGAWDDAARWNQLLKSVTPQYQQTVPGVFANVAIKGSCTISPGLDIELKQNSSGYAGQLSVLNLPASSMAVAPGATLTAESIFNLNEVNPLALLLLSTAQGNGSLIHNNAGVKGRIQKYVQPFTGWPVSNDSWYMLSAPVAGQPVAAFTTPNQPGQYNFYGWNEPTAIWYSYKNQETWLQYNNGLDFNTGQGYKAGYRYSNTFSFSGYINIGDVVISDLTASEGAPNEIHSSGWHLLGNPFASALSWDHPGWERSNICHSAQVWDRNARSYKVLSPGRNEIIDAATGFFIQAEDHEQPGSITLPASARIHRAAPGNNGNLPHRICLKAVDVNDGSYQNSIIQFHSGATELYDPHFDARFLPGYAPQFFSLVHNQRLAVNTLPAFHSELVIPLGFVRNNNSSFKIELSESIPGIRVYLHDKKHHALHFLTKNEPYHFSSAPGDGHMRFEIHFREGAVAVPLITYPEVKMYFSDLFLHLEFSEIHHGGNLEIIDLNGRILVFKNLDVCQNQQIPVNLSTGIFIVRITSPEGVVSRLVNKL